MDSVVVVTLMLAASCLITSTLADDGESASCAESGQGCSCVIHQIPPPDKQVYRDCDDVKRAGFNASGVYTVQPRHLAGGEPLNVYCDMDTDEGGWLVFQRRMDGLFNFFRNWQFYKEGFGSLNGEMWLGNEKLFWLTSQNRYELRIDLRDDRNESRYALYDDFYISDEYSNYTIHIGRYSDGDAGDSLAPHNAKPFSTKDRDNDGPQFHCAQLHRGAWWYHPGGNTQGYCDNSNLNGEYFEENRNDAEQGIIWDTFRGRNVSLTFAEMKIRRKN